MELVIKLLYGAGESIMWGIIFIFVAFVILPQSVMDPMLKRLRPDLTSKPKVISKFKTILDYIFNNKNIVISSNETSKDELIDETEFQELLKEKKSLENNLFFLDMIRSLTSMLFFSVSRTGYDENTTLDILQESMYYLMHYGNNLQNTNGMQNQKERLYKTTSEFEEQITSIIDLKQSSSEEEHKDLFAKLQLKSSVQSFNNTMENEYTSTENQLNKVNQILAQKFMNYVEKS